MLTSVAQPTMSLHIRSHGLGALRCSIAASVRSPGQIRGFKFGLWSSYLDPEYHNEMRRRYRSLKYKQLAAASRIMSCESHPLTEEATQVLRRKASHYWRIKGSRDGLKGESCGRGAARTPENPTGTRPGANIEDTEREALEHLLFGSFPCGDDVWPNGATRGVKSSENASSDRPVTRTNRSRREPNPVSLDPTTQPQVAWGQKPLVVSSIESSFDPGYVIDPISNRRVPKVEVKTSLDEALGPPTKVPEGSPPPFAQFDAPAAPRPAQPIFSDGPPPPAELRKYQNVNIDPNPVELDLVAEHQPVLGSEEYVRDLSAPSSLRTHKENRPSHYQHGAVVWHRDDGMKPLNETEDPSVEHNDLDKYEPVLNKEPPSTEEGKYEDLDKYQPVRHNEPDAQLHGPPEVEQVYPDLVKYKAFMYNEPDGRPVSNREDEVCDAAELSKYDAGTGTAAQGAAALLGTCGPEDLSDYQQPFRHNEPDGGAAPRPDTLAESLEEFDLRSRSDKNRGPYNEPTPEEKADDLDLLRASDIRSSAGRLREAQTTEPAKSNYRAMLESLLPEHNRESDLADQQASEAVKRARSSPSAAESSGDPPRTLTGNYVRDFPEDFEKSWTASPAASAAAASTEAPSSSRLVSALARSSVSFNRSPLTGLARERALSDPYSTTPQGLETSYAEECGGRPTWPTYVRSYGTINSDRNPAQTSGITSSSNGGSKSAADSSSKGSSAPAAVFGTQNSAKQQTVYKILAYDPTMQAVSIAETASTVPDTSQALPPAEALLRLSNPTKFFPYFAPLQAQGFEIVSGSGDVLVFRKVQDVRVPWSSASTQGVSVLERQQQAVEAAVEAATKDCTAAVNPIDMTGAPVSRRLWPSSANFASPTGYLNYDPDPLDRSHLPPPPALPRKMAQTASATETPQRIPSNIDIPRVEEIFSGAEPAGRGEASAAESDDAPRKETRRRPGVLKRVLVGATTVAGVSYAIGVVGEFFKTHPKHQNRTLGDRPRF